MRKTKRLARTAGIGLCTVIAAHCTTIKDAPDNSNPAAQTSGPSFAMTHGVQIYVSAVNCEMNAEDAERINALSVTPGLSVEVVFAGISNNDTSVVEQARRDLGLNVPARLILENELSKYKPIGVTRLPVVLVIKGRQLKTIVTGEAMPRTLSIVEASLSSTAVPSVQP